jgi:vacuolar-type H+-ATPase subunit I/STV1
LFPAANVVETSRTLIIINRPDTDHRACAREACAERDELRGEVEDLKSKLTAAQEAVAEVLDLKARLLLAEKALADERKDQYANH